MASIIKWVLGLNSLPSHRMVSPDYESLRMDQFVETVAIIFPRLEAIVQNNHLMKMIMIRVFNDSRSL